MLAAHNIAAAAAAASSGFWVPPPVSLKELARMRGAMWPKLDAYMDVTNLPFGPRQGRSDNIVMVDYIESYTPEQQKAIMEAYANGAGYKTVPMGPIVDAGYHGQIPPENLLDPAAFSYYLDCAEAWERKYNVRVNHFLRPDAGNLGLEWNADDCRRLLNPLFKTARAQALMRFVTLAWEPGGKYGYNNSWWVEMCQWMTGVFPFALRGIHTPEDEDAPVGPADDGHPNLAAWAWGNVAPYIHCWLVQNAGYTNSENPVPSPEFVREFVKQFDVNNPASIYGRFQKGYAGWPTTCAPWVGGHPYDLDGIVAMPAEYWAFGGYWYNYPAETGAELAREAIAVGAWGAFDAGGARI